MSFILSRIFGGFEENVITNFGYDFSFPRWIRHHIITMKEKSVCADGRQSESINKNLSGSNITGMIAADS
jgi:hypothetical protein